MQLHSFYTTCYQASTPTSPKWSILWLDGWFHNKFTTPGSRLLAYYGSPKQRDLAYSTLGQSHQSRGLPQPRHPRRLGLRPAMSGSPPQLKNKSKRNGLSLSGLIPNLPELASPFRVFIQFLNHVGPYYANHHPDHQFKSQSWVLPTQRFPIVNSPLPLLWKVNCSTHSPGTLGCHTLHKYSYKTICTPQGTIPASGKANHI